MAKQIGGVIDSGELLVYSKQQPFNLVDFIGQGWSIWRGPADGNGLEGDEERDKGAAALIEINLVDVELVICLRQGETVTTGQDRLNRLKADGRCIRLDESAFQAFWENREVLSARFKEKENDNKIRFIFFDGVVLRSPHGRRGTLCMFFGGSGWSWAVYWLASGRNFRSPSAVLSS